MASQLDALAHAPGPATPWPDWRAYYVFYHSDRTRLVRELVGPLVSELLRSGTIERFFFVRYGLGGPHLRLRWRVRDEAAAAAAESLLARAAACFFAAWPSTATLSVERIRAANRKYLREGARPEDLLASEPDASWRRVAVELEVERYGGARHLPASLDLFTLSSAHVLRRLGPGEGVEPVLSAGLRAMLHLAWGFARDERAFAELAGYGPRFMGTAFESCARAGEAFFARRRRQLVELVSRELASLTAPQHEPFDPDHLGAAALGLMDATKGALAARWDIAASHIHMTANRLGLTNGDEVYVSRMLSASLDALRDEQPEAWRRAWETRDAFARRARRRGLQASIAALRERRTQGGRP